MQGPGSCGSSGRAENKGLKARRSRLEKVILLLLGLALFGSQLHAQDQNSTLSGVVKSASGLPVANARMVIKNTSNSEMKSVIEQQWYLCFH